MEEKVQIIITRAQDKGKVKGLNGLMIRLQKWKWNLQFQKEQNATITIDVE